MLDFDGLYLSESMEASDQMPRGTCHRHADSPSSPDAHDLSRGNATFPLRERQSRKMRMENHMNLPNDLRTAALARVKEVQLGNTEVNPDDHTYFYFGTQRYTVVQRAPGQYDVLDSADVQVRAIDTTADATRTGCPSRAADSEAFIPGSMVKSIKGEIDLDEHSRDRVTPPGTIGYIAGCDSTGHWDIVFANSAWVKLTTKELSDRRQYEVMTPARMAMALNMVRFIDEGLNKREEAPTGSDYNSVLSTLVPPI